MKSAIVGIGKWLPEQVRTNDAWPAAFTEVDHASGERTFNDIPESGDPVSAAILARDLMLEARDPFLGAVERRVADADAKTGARDAVTHAARAALADAGIAGSRVDLVISYDIVPDRVGPPSACHVAHAVGASNAVAYGMDSTCAASVIQLGMAACYLEAGLAQVVLLTQSHLLLRAMPFMHPATPGLGDAASALVMTRGSGLALRAIASATHGEYEHAVAWVRGADQAGDLPWWKAGGDYRLGSHAPDQVKLLMRETVSFGATTVREAAARAEIDPERIAALASVQPRGFIPGGIAERLGLARERAVTTYGEIAHVGACGPIFNLERARARGLLPTGAVVALYGQGAGFTRAAALLEAT